MYNVIQAYHNVKEENYYEKKVQTVVLNNAININKKSNQP
jgi:hypothetical protein